MHVRIFVKDAVNDSSWHFYFCWYLLIAVTLVIFVICRSWQLLAARMKTFKPLVNLRFLNFRFFKHSSCLWKQFYSKRFWGWETYTLSGPLEAANLNPWPTHATLGSRKQFQDFQTLRYSSRNDHVGENKWSEEETIQVSVLPYMCSICPTLATRRTTIP